VVVMLTKEMKVENDHIMRAMDGGVVFCVSESQRQQDDQEQGETKTNVFNFNEAIDTPAGAAITPQPGSRNAGVTSFNSIDSTTFTLPPGEAPVLVNPTTTIAPGSATLAPGTAVTTQAVLSVPTWAPTKAPTTLAPTLTPTVAPTLKPTLPPNGVAPPSLAPQNLTSTASTTSSPTSAPTLASSNNNNAVNNNIGNIRRALKADTPLNLHTAIFFAGPKEAAKWQKNSVVFTNTQAFNFYTPNGKFGGTKYYNPLWDQTDSDAYRQSSSFMYGKSFLYANFEPAGSKIFQFFSILLNTVLYFINREQNCKTGIIIMYSKNFVKKTIVKSAKKKDDRLGPAAVGGEQKRCGVVEDLGARLHRLSHYSRKSAAEFPIVNARGHGLVVKEVPEGL